MTGFRIQVVFRMKFEDSGFRIQVTSSFFTPGFRIQVGGFRIQDSGSAVIIQIGLKRLHVTTTGDRAGLFVVLVSPKHRREFCHNSA